MKWRLYILQNLKDVYEEDVQFVEHLVRIMAKFIPEISSEEIHKVTKNINTIILGLKDGDGAFNYVSKDTTLVKRIENTMKNIDEGTTRFNQNMEALKHSFLTRGYFRKQAKKEKKE